MKPLFCLTDTHLHENNRDVVIDIFQQALNIALDNDIDIIYHLGDILESRKAQTQLLLQTFENILDMFQDNGVKIRSIVGNHDKTDYRSKDSFLSPFKHHPSFQLVEDSDIIVEDDTVVCYLSYFDDDIYCEKLKQLISKVDKQYGQYKRRILLTHIGVNGAIMNNGTEIDSNVTTKMLDFFDKVYIGHYHDQQSFANINYIGSSIQHNFGEEIQKGLTVIEPNLDFYTIDLDFPKYVTLHQDVKQLDQAQLDDIKNIKESNDNFYRVVLNGTEKEIKAFDVKSLSNLGVKVIKNVEKIELKQIEQQLQPFNNQTLKQQFKYYCTKNNLDITIGSKYFDQIVK